MIKKTKPAEGLEELHEVKNAGFKETKKVKRDKSVNRRAGLHDKLKNLEGEVRVKRRKPLGLKHVRRMRKFAAVAAVGAVGAIAVVGVGFFSPKKTTELNQDFQTVCFTAPSDGTKPTDHTLVENVGYMNYVLQNQEYWSSEMFSTVVSLGFSQTVETYKQYYDGVLISADVAKGFSSKATQFCVANGIVMWRPSANKNFDKMNTPWSTGEAQAMTVNTYKKNRGFPPSEFSVYVLNELTIANATEYSVVDNGDGTYAMTLNLNVNTGEDETSADYYYKLQMKVTGDLYDCPTIHSTSVTYVFDENWRILEFEISDSYNAPIAANFAPGCTSDTKVKFDYGEENAVNTFWKDYFSSEYDRVKDSLVDGAKEEENTDNAMGYLSGAFASVLTEGAVFKVDLNVDELNLNGVVSVEMENSKFSGLSAKLGDILVWLDGETLYINDGASKYKLNINGLLSSDETGEEGGDLLGGFDVAALMDQMTEGTFIFNEETGVATLNSEVELFGLKIPMEFEFQKAEDGGVELNFLKAEIALGEKVVKAKLSFGTESDKPAIPTDTAAYQDVLNDGITFGISLNLNGFTLDGIAKIIMQNGAFAGVYAKLDVITVYYDCTNNMLYLSKGSVKYSLAVSALGTGDADLSSTLGSLEINSLLADALANLSASETALGTNLDINIDALGTALKAALDIRLFGGLKVDAGLTVDKLNLSVGVALTNEKVTLPDVSEYQDILNTVITLDVNLTLETGLTNGLTGKRDEAVLEGKVALRLKDGAVIEIRADFGGLAVYFDFTSNSLYLKVGTTKVLLNLNEMDLTNTAILSSLGGSEIIPADLPDAIKELLTNLIGDGKAISTDANLSVFNSIIPVSAKLDLSEGLSASVGFRLLGIDAVAKVALSEDTLERLSAEEKEKYVDVLKEGHKIVESLIGDHISATVEGTLYMGDEIKYGFTAALEYAKGDEGVKSGAYIHLKIGLNAKQPTDDSLYIDLVLVDANPVDVDASGKTTGGYTTDEKYDIYLSVSKYAENSAPLQIYAPVDEVLTLVSMVGAMANLDKAIEQIKVENSAALISAIGKISSLLDEMLINEYLPDESVQDKFASLGDSLIPQILGISLGELLNGLIGDGNNAVKEVEETDFSLSDKYVSSIKTTDESLIFVLNSSLIYNNESVDDLTVEFTRLNKEGVYYVGGINLENVYFGENLSNKLNLGLQLGYDEIARPDASTAFKGYLNATGLDTLVNAFVNSATHKVEGTENDYDLNHTYYLSGSITAKISVLLINPTVTVDVKSLAVYIDPVTNKVYADVHLHFSKGIAINENTDTYMSFKNDMVYIKRVTSTTEYRVMTMNSFLADIMNQIVFVTNLSNTISGYLQDMDMSGNSIDMESKDYGSLLDYILASYIFSANENSASWSFALNKELLTDLVGMTVKDNIPVTINAVKNPDDSYYTLTGLDIASSSKPAEMTLVKGVVSLNLYGSFTYQNPHEVVNAGYENSAYYLAEEKAVDGYSWLELLGGETSEEILKAVNWTRLLRETSGSTYLKYNGSNLHAGMLKFEYASDDTNANFVEFGERQLVLYGSSSIYTRLTYPDVNSYMPPIDIEGSTDKLVGVWDDYYTAISDDSGANIAMRARYNNVVIKFVSAQPLEGLIDYDSYEWNADGYYVYSKTYAYSDEDVVELSALSDLNTYIFQGYYDYSTGEKITEVSLNSAHTVYVDWVGKTINITYASDLDISSEASEDGYYYLTNTAVYGEDDTLLTPTVSASNVQFLGWFIQNGESYAYIADAQALKDYFANTTITGDSVDCKLWAVWYNDTVTGEVSDESYYKYNNLFSKTWYIKGKINLPFSGKSLEIYQNTSDLSLTMQIKYGISKDGSTMKNDLDNNKFENINVDGSFEKTISSTHGNDKGKYSGGDVKIVINLNGKSITLQSSVWAEYKVK